MDKIGYKDMVIGISNERIEKAINEYVHKPRDRKVLKLCLMHGLSYTAIAGRTDLDVSSRTVQTIMHRWMPIIKEHF